MSNQTEKKAEKTTKPKTNKSNKKILIIVAAAAVLLVGVMLLLIFLPKGGEGTATYDEGVKMSVSTDESGVHQAVIATNPNGEIENNSYGKLLEYTPAQISEIHVENQSGSFDVKSYTPVDENGKSGTTVYTLVGYEDFELQTGIPDDVANDAAKLEFTKVVSLDGKDSDDFGFDKPTATATVKYNDGTSAAIIVGDNAPQDAGTYVKFGDSNTIYLVAQDAVDSFSYSVTQFISLTINDSASDTSASQASVITMGGSHLSKAITIEPNSNTNINASYKITSPVNAYASEKASSNVEGNIRGLYAESVKMVNPSAGQLSELGLSSPYATVHAEYPDTTVDLMASQPDGEGYVYLMKDGGNIVYRILAEKVAWATVTFDEMLSEYMIAPSMMSLSEMKVDDGKKTYDFELDSTTVTTSDDEGSETTSTTTTVKLGKEEIELGYFTTYFQNVSLITRADSDTESYSGSPVYSVTYSYSSGGSDTVSYYDNGGSRYLAVVNGTAVGHAYKANINKLIDQTAQIADNKEVSVIESN